MPEENYMERINDKKEEIREENNEIPETESKGKSINYIIAIAIIVIVIIIFWAYFTGRL